MRSGCISLAAVVLAWSGCKKSEPAPPAAPPAPAAATAPKTASGPRGVLPGLSVGTASAGECEAAYDHVIALVTQSTSYDEATKASALTSMRDVEGRKRALAECAQQPVAQVLCVTKATSVEEASACVPPPAAPAEAAPAEAAPAEAAPAAATPEACAAAVDHIIQVVANEQTADPDQRAALVAELSKEETRGPQLTTCMSFSAAIVECLTQAESGAAIQACNPAPAEAPPAEAPPTE